MDSKKLRVAISDQGRSFEAEGQADEVRQLLDEFATWVQDAPSTSASQQPFNNYLALSNQVASDPTSSSSIGESADIPFGEYLQQFSEDITDADKALVAASHVQFCSEDNTFTTRNVNAVLLEQGIRLSNPSQSIRRNTANRRVFTVSRGKFRVSRDGQSHINGIIRDGNSAKAHSTN